MFFLTFLSYYLLSNVFNFNDMLSGHSIMKSISLDLNVSSKDYLSKQTVLDEISCKGILEQGGMVFCKTKPNTKVKIGRSISDFYYETSSSDGNIIIGFDRDERDNFVEVNGHRLDFIIPKRDYSISKIDGLPPSQVSSFNEEQLKKIKISSRKKTQAFASRQTKMGFKNGFINPLKNMNKTSPFGSQRILNGITKKPHYGVDIAAEIGTKIYAPADGVISLSDDDLYFEGSMVLIDHGQGLISMYLHTEKNLVFEGEHVKQGQLIATVGSKGRSTGPHLCWRLKWRNRNLDPEILTRWPKDDKK